MPHRLPLNTRAWPPLKRAKDPAGGIKFPQLFPCPRALSELVVFVVRGEAGHSGHETGVGIGQAQDRKGHVLTLSYVLKRKKIV